MKVSSQRDAARVLRYRLTGIIVVPVVRAYARESVACAVSASAPREG